jgi:hypothetical protein
VVGSRHRRRARFILRRNCVDKKIWMAAIEDTGRHDWYEPLRKRLGTKSYMRKQFARLDG